MAITLKKHLLVILAQSMFGPGTSTWEGWEHHKDVGRKNPPSPSPKASAGRALFLAALQGAPLKASVGTIDNQIGDIEKALKRGSSTPTELDDFISTLDRFSAYLVQSRNQYTEDYSWLQRHQHYFGLSLSKQHAEDYEAKKHAKELLDRVNAARRRAVAKKAKNSPKKSPASQGMPFWMTATRPSAPVNGQPTGRYPWRS
jgi:septal ring factor EnvC (AmiA/AmiB activator)